MKKIKAEIVADSINTQGDRITSYILTYPRMIHAEVMTHRMFSRNAASSRAIPFAKMLKDVQEDPFIPIAWQKDHKGMQGTEYFTDPQEIETCELEWMTAANSAAQHAKRLNTNGNEAGITKQLCNRLLEPFLWYTNLVTVTEMDNFFELRCPKYGSEGFKSRKDLDAFLLNEGEAAEPVNRTDLDYIKLSNSGAEIHIQVLAEAMWDARNENTPKELKAGEWHIPFGDKIVPNFSFSSWHSEEKYRLKVATARCARLSYMTFDGEIDYEKDIALHDMLKASKHSSPFEHCAKAMSDIEYNTFIKGPVRWGNKYESKDHVDFFHGDGTIFGSTPKGNLGWCNNFKGFIQYRYIIENE